MTLNAPNSPQADDLSSPKHLARRAYPGLRFFHVVLIAAVLFGLVGVYWIVTDYIPTWLSAQRASDKYLVHRIGYAYFSFVDWHGRSPARADVETTLKQDAEALAALREGHVVVRWGAAIGGVGNDRIVVAYQSIVPEHGGFVYMGDGVTHWMQAEEFRAAVHP